MPGNLTAARIGSVFAPVWGLAALGGLIGFVIEGRLMVNNIRAVGPISSDSGGIVIFMVLLGATTGLLLAKRWRPKNPVEPRENQQNRS